MQHPGAIGGAGDGVLLEETLDPGPLWQKYDILLCVYGDIRHIPTNEPLHFQESRHILMWGQQLMFTTVKTNGTNDCNSEHDVVELTACSEPT